MKDERYTLPNAHTDPPRTERHPVRLAEIPPKAIMKTEPSAFPNGEIQATGTISNRFRELGIADVQTAISFVQNLPYGRPRHPENELAVLTEHVGTCSTKHALLCRLCDEQDLAVQLMLGIYAMTEQNTPGVGSVLAAHDLEAIPEAHCYLRYNGSRFDFTGTSATGKPIARILHEESIQPDQIGDYKERLHREALATWRDVHDCDHKVEELWEIREACISALSTDTPLPDQSGRKED